MRERPIAFESDVRLAGALCLPEDAAADRAVPAIVLLGGTGGDTRDGDMAPERTPGIIDPPKRGLLRRIAHHLAHHGIATLRFDKRGCGESGGTADGSDYDTDLVDNIAAFRWLQKRPEVDLARVGLAGHSAGAFNACLVCRDVAEVACVGLLGALYGPIDQLVRWNWPRVAQFWSDFSEEQRAWLRRERAREVVGAFRTEEFIAAALRGDDRVTLAAEGIAMQFDTRRFRQDLARPVAAEFRHVRCPALVLHGGNDMNVQVADCLNTYQALRHAGNEAVDLVIIPGVDHSFQPVSADRARRVWDRVSLETFGRPVSPLALDAISSWAVRVLRPEQPAGRQEG